MIHSVDIFSIHNPASFKEHALEVFKYQFNHNRVYRSFCDLLYKHPSNISEIEDIPFLPIQFFKSHNVLCDEGDVEKTFLSSGTTGMARSKHHIADLSIYIESFAKGFNQFYGKIEDYCILALLPSYLEQQDSSLIYMTDHLINQSRHSDSGYYLDNTNELRNKLTKLEESRQKTLLIGVSYALLDFVEKFQFNLSHTVVMETGGMKGRRKELVREELHQLLKKGFGVTTIHSEYGMTELLSQAYSQGEGVFNCPPWLKILSRSVQDPFQVLEFGRTGGLNVIDLANINSCSFIATQDLGKVYENGNFEVIGRFDTAEIRGCNLMAL